MKVYPGAANPELRGGDCLGSHDSQTDPLAVRLRDPGLENLKTAPFPDPLRTEQRIKAIARELKSPEHERGAT